MLKNFKLSFCYPAGTKSFGTFGISNKANLAFHLFQKVYRK